MSDIHCAHCREPWDTYGLQHESIGYLDDDQADMLAPLGTVHEVIAHAVRLGHESYTALGELLAGVPELPDTLTLPEVFTWFWTDADPDSDEYKAAETVVQAAIYTAVKAQKGCPSCGFDHARPGEHAETTRRELVDGVDDQDPAPYLT